MSTVIVQKYSLPLPENSEKTAVSESCVFSSRQCGAKERLIIQNVKWVWVLQTSTDKEQTEKATWSPAEAESHCPSQRWQGNRWQRKGILKSRATGHGEGRTNSARECPFPRYTVRAYTTSLRAPTWRVGAPQIPTQQFGGLWQTSDGSLLPITPFSKWELTLQLCHFDCSPENREWASWYLGFSPQVSLSKRHRRLACDGECC